MVERDAAASQARSWLEESPGHIGPFKILRRLGEGGMGVVFLAEEERPHRRVALKVIHAGALSPRTLRRFELEAETLGRLQHPGIAQIYSAGTYATPQGLLPYFAMEYVEGARLDEHARLRGLGVHARLELFARVCDAVEHAHQKGVVHRDIKPGNVLVTSEGQPKILDFGVARVTDPDLVTTTLHTASGALMGTLPYMSPEQVGGDSAEVDARSDVYSLGVVLYELLAGRLPYHVERRALHEAMQVIREEEPSKLSTHSHDLRGDIETIVGKALEKQRARRYASASALAADIRHYLADEPIAARPPSTWYQLTKFARRNKVFVGALAAVFLALLAGVGVATTFFVREQKLRQVAEAERLRAESEGTRATQVASFLTSLFAGIDPEVARGADTTLLASILDQARGRIDGELADQPEVQADLHATLGGVYVQLGRWEEAEHELRAAEAIRLARYGADDRRTLKVQSELGTLLKRRGEHAASEEAQRAALERQQAALGANDPDVIATRLNLADSLMRQGKYRESEAEARAVLAKLESEGRGEEEITLGAKMTLVQTLQQVGRDAEAQPLVEEVFLWRSKHLGDDHPETIVALETMAGCLDGTGQAAEGEEAHREALLRARRVWGEDGQQTLAVLNNLAVSLGEQGRWAEAEPLVRDCLERRTRVLGPEHDETLLTVLHLYKNLRQQGRTQPELLEHAYAGFLRTGGPDYGQTAEVRHMLAALRKEQFRYREAAELLEQVAEHRRRTMAPEDPTLAMALYNWAGTLQDGDEFDASEEPLREALALVEEHHFENELFVPAAENALARVLARRGEDEEADELFARALATRRRWYGDVHPETSMSLIGYGQSLVDRGQNERAEPLLREASAVQDQLYGRDEWRRYGARAAYGRCLALLGRYAEAEPLLVEANENFERIAEPPDLGPEARQWLLELYDAWDAASPDQGIAARSERWRAAALEK